MGMTARDAFEITLRRLEETTALLQETCDARDTAQDAAGALHGFTKDLRDRIAQLEEDNRSLEQQRDAAVDECQKMIAATSRRETILARFYERAQAAQQWLAFYGRGRPAGARADAQSLAQALASTMQEAYEYCDQVPF